VTHLDFGTETHLPIMGGSIRCPAFPEDCSYVRVCNDNGDEIAYWTADEWREEPEQVMGAIIGAAMRPTVVGMPHTGVDEMTGNRSANQVGR
jgi:hypothetical protein